MPALAIHRQEDLSHIKEVFRGTCKLPTIVYICSQENKEFVYNSYLQSLLRPGCPRWTLYHRIWQTFPSGIRKCQSKPPTFRRATPRQNSSDNVRFWVAWVTYDVYSLLHGSSLSKASHANDPRERGRFCPSQRKTAA